MAEWLSYVLVEQEDRGSIPGLATWIFRDWLSPASKSRYGWKIAKSTLILKITKQPTIRHYVIVRGTSDNSLVSCYTTHCIKPIKKTFTLDKSWLWQNLNSIDLFINKQCPGVKVIRPSGPNYWKNVEWIPYVFSLEYCSECQTNWVMGQKFGTITFCHF